MSASLPNEQLVVALILVGIIAWELYALMRAYESLRWRSAAGTIVSARVEEERDSESLSRTFSPRVRYRYHVGTQSFESSRYSYQGRVFARFEDAQRLLRGLSKGAGVEVFYDPGSPSRAVLVRGYCIWNFVNIAVLLFILVLAVNWGSASS